MFIGKGSVAEGQSATGERHAASAACPRLGELTSGEECSHEISRVTTKQEAGVETGYRDVGMGHVGPCALWCNQRIPRGRDHADIHARRHAK
jgi:hypothetical protein